MIALILPAAVLQISEDSRKCWKSLGVLDQEKEKVDFKSNYKGKMTRTARDNLKEELEEEIKTIQAIQTGDAPRLSAEDWEHFAFLGRETAYRNAQQANLLDGKCYAGLGFDPEEHSLFEGREAITYVHSKWNLPQVCKLLDTLGANRLSAHTLLLCSCFRDGGRIICFSQRTTTRSFLFSTSPNPMPFPTGSVA